MIDTNMIATLGFPITITCYLLWERQNTTREMIKVLGELNIAIIKLKERMKKI